MPHSNESIHSIDPTTLTPAMRQYQQYKQQYPDAILFFRIGDFYECFYEDARTVARVLSVALTARSKGENAVPMAGVPYHAVETYLHRMIAAGYKVAICEQMEEPKAGAGAGKGVIKREVTRLVTPGTLTEDAMLDGREENFLAGIVALDGSDSTTNPSENRAAATIENQKSKIENPNAAIAWCELSTGKFLTYAGTLAACLDELARVRPRELIYAEPADQTLRAGAPPEHLEGIKAALNLALTARPAWQLDAHHAQSTLKTHYGVTTFAGFGYAGDGKMDMAADLALRAAGALVAYLHETQKAALEHLQPPRGFARSNHLLIDPVSLRSLEVLRTIRNNAVDGSLVHALDRTQTPMGSRLLRNWLCYPLCDIGQIRRRQDAVAQMVHNHALLTSIRTALEGCSDIERITARLCCRRATPRDLVALARSMDILAKAGDILEAAPPAPETGLLPAKGIRAGEKAENRKSKIENQHALIPLMPAARELSKAIRACLPEDPPAHLRDGNVLKDGCHPELDRLRAMSRDSRAFLANYQAKLIERTGITSLKVGYNKVFGFYIEVTHSHAQKIPPDFNRKQTVRNAERYITPELKQYEAEILTAQERSVALEQELFEGLRAELATRVEKLQQLAAAAAELDVTCGLAHLARQRHYTRPTITLDKVLHIVDGRHPVVEQALGEKFVPNDTTFGEFAVASGQGSEARSLEGKPRDGNPGLSQRAGNGETTTAAPPTTDLSPLTTLHLITGPNMAGKSTYIRQVALLVLMAQAGSFIPAREATIGIVDRVFTRVGAADDLAGGQSTFMVEMTETANILHHATERSLVILDEIGRGTSTLDGLALAWAIAEFLAFTSKCRTLFATHYHELTELADVTPAGGGGNPVANFNVLVREWEDQIIFMHRIAPGQADKSYGVHVARLAGVPRSVISRARQLMSQLAVHVGKTGMGGKAKAAATAVVPQLGMFDGVDQQALTQLRSLDMNRMSPMQAWEALKTLQGMLNERKG